MQRKLVEIIFENAGDAEKFARTEGIRAESRDGGRVVVAVQGDYDSWIRETAKYKVRSLDVAAQNLEDVFMHFYDRKENRP